MFGKGSSAELPEPALEVHLELAQRDLEGSSWIRPLAAARDLSYSLYAA